MPEAVNGVIDYLFNELNLDFLFCSHFDFNKQSQRVQEKCGFKPYRSMVVNTRMYTQEKEIINLLLNPKKDIKLEISHPETLLYKG